MALFAATAVGVAVPRHFAGAELLPQANVTLAHARATAVRAHPGLGTDQEIEEERGGTGLRYSFDIKHHGETFEVGIDARTGAVLENDAEGANPTDRTVGWRLRGTPLPCQSLSGRVWAIEPAEEKQ